jgi:hypothetical protein
VPGVIHCGAGALLMEVSMAGLAVRQDHVPYNLRSRAARERDVAIRLGYPLERASFRDLVHEGLRWSAPLCG